MRWLCCGSFVGRMDRPTRDLFFFGLSSALICVHAFLGKPKAIFRRKMHLSVYYLPAGNLALDESVDFNLPGTLHCPDCGSPSLMSRSEGFRCGECGWSGMHPVFGPNQAQPRRRTLEAHVKVEVMVPCSDCQVMMFSASVFCPNCGARRKK